MVFPTESHIVIFYFQHKMHFKETHYRIGSAKVTVLRKSMDVIFDQNLRLKYNSTP